MGNINERAEREAKRHRKDTAVGESLGWKLDSALSRSGVVLTGLAFKIQPGDVLLTVKGVKDGGSVVAFVGSESVSGALLKAYGAAKVDKLVWRPDRYST